MHLLKDDLANGEPLNRKFITFYKNSIIKMKTAHIRQHWAITVCLATALGLFVGCTKQAEEAQRPEVVKTLAQFDTIVKLGGTPLDKLSPNTLAEFRQSLVFTDRGLSGFKYEDIEKELFYEEAIELYKLFGFNLSADPQKAARKAGVSATNDAKAVSDGGGRGSSDFLENYYCHSKGTCKAQNGYACTNNC